MYVFGGAPALPGTPSNALLKDARLESMGGTPMHDLVPVSPAPEKVKKIKLYGRREWWYVVALPLFLLLVC